MDSPITLSLFVVGAGLLIAVTGGIAYLTVAEWRDRRRRNKEKRGK